MKIEFEPLGAKHKYRIVTLGAVKKNLQDSFITLFVPEGINDDTEGILITVQGGLRFCVIEK